MSIKDLELILANAIASTKAATRQYAKRQIRWIRLKLLAALSTANALNKIYLLDGTELDQWSNNVTSPAIRIIGQLLAGEELELPSNMSAAASELLTPKRSIEFSDRRDLWIRQDCEYCNMTAVTVEDWQRHLGSRGHRRALKKHNNKLLPGKSGLDNGEDNLETDMS